MQVSLVASTLQIAVLKEIYRYWVIHDQGIAVDQISCIISKEELAKQLELLELSALVQKTDDIYEITAAGRSKFTVVLTGGVYDLIHRGHIVTLNEAANLADFLIVVVAHDITVENRKRKPFHSAEDRAALLNALDMVGAAVIGDEHDHMRVVRRIKPNVIALGSDQHHMVERLKEQVSDQGFPNTQIVRLSAEYEGMATTKLINKIIDRYQQLRE